MKKKSFNKRLSLNKSVISNLNLKDVKGGLEIVVDTRTIISHAAICNINTSPAICHHNTGPQICCTKTMLCDDFTLTDKINPPRPF